MSVEDKRAMSILESSAKLCNGHYELCLPWKSFPPVLPNNRPVAEHRLAFLTKYRQSMDNLFDKGYAMKVLEESLSP